jgi:hypothetical protein
VGLALRIVVRDAQVRALPAAPERDYRPRRDDDR